MKHLALLFWTFYLSLVSTAEASYVKMSYVTDFYIDNNYHIFDQHNVTLVCEFNQDPFEVIWRIETQTVYYYYAGIGIPTDSYKHRILRDSNTETTITLTINVQKDLDEGTTWICDVFQTASQQARDHIEFLSVPALSPPTSVTLLPVTPVIENKNSPNFQCTVSSIYPGKSATDIILQVGNNEFLGGTLTEQEMENDLVTVTKSFTQTFVRDQNGTNIFCKVLWMKATIVEEIKTSATQLLIVYYPALSVSSPTISPSIPKLEGTVVVISCFTNSYPDPQLTLYRKGVTDFVHKETSTNLTWSMTLTEQDHQSQYYCRAEDGDMYDGWDFDVKSPEDLRIDVWFKAKIVSISADSSSEVREGDSKSISCSAYGNPDPALTLYRGEGEEKTQIFSATRRLVYDIQIDRQINGENFYCEATLADISIPLQYAKISSKAYYTVKFPPRRNIIYLNAASQVLAKSVQTVTCTSGSSNPVSSMVWKKGETVVKSGVMVQASEGEYMGEVLHSVFTFTALKSDNGVSVTCTPIWEGYEHTHLKKDVYLNVLYPPAISVQGVSSPLDEGSQIVITCKIEAGNPENITTQYWEFEPKYSGSKSQALPEQGEKRELKIDKTLYHDAGTYRCTAGNAVGNHTGELQIVVHYDPKILASDTTDIVYSDLYERAVLTIAVRAFPGLDDVQSAFLWTRSTGGVLNNALVTSTAQNHDIFLSKMVIDPVDAGHYGQYTVEVKNKINAPLTVSLELRPRGPPKPVSEVTIIAIAAEQILISFRVGANGGSQQIFYIVIRETESNKETEVYMDYVDPSKGSVLNFTIQNLQPETKYIASVYSSNFYGEQSSDFFQFTTRVKPVVNEYHLKVHIDNTAVLSWKYDVKDISVTSVVIEQCLSNTNCLEHNVTTNTDQIIELSVSDGDIFFLVIYQDGLEAYRSQAFSQVSEDDQLPVMANPEAQGTVPIGGIVGGTLTAVILITIVVASSIWFCKRKGSQKQDSNVAISEIPEYINMKPNDSPYQDLENKDVSETAVYQELNKN